MSNQENYGPLRLAIFNLVASLLVFVLMVVTTWLVVRNEIKSDNQKIVLQQYQTVINLIAERSQPDSAIRKVIFVGQNHEKYFPKSSLCVVTWDKQVYIIPPDGIMNVMNEDTFNALIQSQ